MKKALLYILTCYMFCRVCLPAVELLLNKAKVAYSKLLVDETETSEDDFVLNEYKSDPLTDYNDSQLGLLPRARYLILPIELLLSKNEYHCTIFVFNLLQSDIWQPPQIS